MRHDIAPPDPVGFEIVLIPCQKVPALPGFGIQRIDDDAIQNLHHLEGMARLGALTRLGPGRQDDREDAGQKRNQTDNQQDIQHGKAFRHQISVGRRQRAARGAVPWACPQTGTYLRVDPGLPPIARASLENGHISGMTLDMAASGVSLPPWQFGEEACNRYTGS